MKVTPLEFAHTLRGMRSSYGHTVRYVEGKIERLAEEERRRAKLREQYQEASKQLTANPKKFE